MKTASTLLKNFLNGNFYGLRHSAASQFVSVASPVGMSATQSRITVAASVKANAFSAASSYFSLRQHWVANGWLFTIVPGTKKFSFGLGDSASGQHNVSADAVMNLGQTYFFVGTYDGQKVRLYVNGVKQTTESSMVDTFVGNSAIGWSWSGASPGDALADETLIYNRALSDAEVQLLSSGVVLPSGLILYWGFDEGSGTVATDLSGSGNNGVVQNSPAYTLFDPFPGREQILRTADLYTFTLNGGAVYRWTSADFDIRYGGNTYLANGPLFERTRITTRVGLEVTEMELVIAARSTDQLGSSPFISAARSGAFDGATVRVDRAIMPTWGNTSLGTVLQFLGNVATAELRRLGVKLMVRSATQLLNVQLPRNLFQAGCRWTLYDTGCALTKASFASASSVTGGSTATQINCGLAQASGYFDLGTITFTSGANNGVSRSVKSYTPGVLRLSVPLLFVPSPGDTFNAYPGCDKQLSTCVNKFSNKPNYGGAPFIPLPETAQ